MTEKEYEKDLVFHMNVVKLTYFSVPFKQLLYKLTLCKASYEIGDVHHAENANGVYKHRNKKVRRNFAAYHHKNKHRKEKGQRFKREHCNYHRRRKPYVFRSITYQLLCCDISEHRKVKHGAYSHHYKWRSSNYRFDYL